MEKTKNKDPVPARGPAALPAELVKRTGEAAAFDPEKIKTAMKKAFEAVGERCTPAALEYLCESVENRFRGKKSVGIEDVQDAVETALMKSGYHDVARAYIKYRYARALARRENTTDASIMALLRNRNKLLAEENSNKDTTVASTQRDYIAGEVSRDMTRRVLLPKRISEAHDEGILHFHDADYFIQDIFNCFHRDTQFLADHGVRRFRDFRNGEKTTVLCRDGEWREATVRYYGMREMQAVTFRNVTDPAYKSAAGNGTRTVRCTPDHRWILADGSVTTSLEVGDELMPLQVEGTAGLLRWKAESIEPLDGTHSAWCVEEPATHSFTLFNGIVTGNCCLVNMKDMLDNGTVINKKMITGIKNFRVACTVASQIIACVASNQYGGQSVDTQCLGRFLALSREKFEKRARENAVKSNIPEDLVDRFVELQARSELKDELASGIQTIQYQLNTLMTTNGQSPFVTLFLYLRADDPYIKENAMVIEEILKQRIKGIQNEQGVYVTPAFPKLVYVLDGHNCLEGGEYDWLTKLAVQCSSVRMYPDYISAKKMRENYQGNCFSCMGCRSFLAPWKDEDGAFKFEGRLIIRIEPTLNFVNAYQSGVSAA